MNDIWMCRQSSVTGNWLGSTGPFAANERLGRRKVSATVVNRLIDFTTMDRHLLRSLNAQAHLISTNFHNNDSDIVVDDHAFVFFAR